MLKKDNCKLLCSCPEMKNRLGQHRTSGIPPASQDRTSGIPPTSQDRTSASLQHHRTGLPASLQHHRTGLPASLQHHRTGLTASLQHHRTGLPASLQHHRTGLPASLQHHRTGLPASLQHHRTGLRHPSNNTHTLLFTDPLSPQRVLHARVCTRIHTCTHSPTPTHNTHDRKGGAKERQKNTRASQHRCTPGPINYLLCSEQFS